VKTSRGEVIKNVFVCSALSGYGIMASPAAGSLVAAHLAGTWNFIFVLLHRRISSIILFHFISHFSSQGTHCPLMPKHSLCLDIVIHSTSNNLRQCRQVNCKIFVFKTVVPPYNYKLHSSDSPNTLCHYFFWIVFWVNFCSTTKIHAGEFLYPLS
jgi:hypothetical protein